MPPQLAADVALQQQLASQYGFSNIGNLMGAHSPALSCTMSAQMFSWFSMMP
jgi:hypothetical protein